MRPARARWAGFLLTLVWMAARLVLPLQPTCPHHALAAHESVAERGAPHQASATGGAEANGAAANAVAGLDAASENGHHGHGSGADVDGVAGGHGPVDSTGAPECECAAHCCAASTLQIALAPLVAYVAMVEAPEVVPISWSSERIPLRLDVSQPPATAPPALTA